MQAFFAAARHLHKLGYLDDSCQPAVKKVELARAAVLPELTAPPRATNIGITNKTAFSRPDANAKTVLHEYVQRHGETPNQAPKYDYEHQDGRFLATVILSLRR